MSDARALPQDYPPAAHVLRDLGLWSDSGADDRLCTIATATVAPW